MESKKTKLEEALKVSEDILNHIEEGNLPFENVILKCKKLARLRDDYDAIDWFSLELHGYDSQTLPANVDPSKVYTHACRSGRSTKVLSSTTFKHEDRYWTTSVPALEASVQSDTAALQNLKPPDKFSPAVHKSSYESIYTGPTSNEYVVEKYQDVLTAINAQRTSLSSNITHNRALLSKIKNSIYNYVLQINLQLRFESVSESIFQEAKVAVDKRLSDLCPDAIKKFVAAYSRLSSENEEEWSQAMSSCRNILKAFSDVVFPPEQTAYELKSGEKIDVTDDKYKNRLIAFVDKSMAGSKAKLLKSRVNDLCARLHDLNDLLSKGTHAGITLLDAQMCIIETYFLIASLLQLLDVKAVAVAHIGEKVAS